MDANTVDVEDWVENLARLRRPEGDFNLQTALEAWNGIVEEDLVINLPGVSHD